MTPWAALAIFAAGLGAGTVNVIVGSGSLITFPTLLALGYPPVLANVSNNVGLVPGSVSAVHAYRHELVGQRSRLLTLGPASLAGGITGAVVLIALPHSVFKAAVLALVLNGVAGVVFILVAHIDWAVVALIAAGSVIGGQLGGHYGRRLPTAVLRACVVVVGVSVSVVLFVTWH